MDIKIVDHTGKEVPSGPKEPQEDYKGLVPEGVIMQQQIGQLFDFKPSEVDQYKPKINTLIEYAKLKTDDHSPEGLKWALRNLQLKLGTPPIGEKMISYLTRYAYLYLESQKIEKEKQQFLRGEEDR